MAKEKELNTVQRIIIGIDKSDEVVLQLNMDKGMELDWDFLSFRKLPNSVQDKLSVPNLKRYVLAEAKAEERAKKIGTKKIEVGNPFNPLQGHAASREFIRVRKGWHQAWKNPGREFDEAMSGPYKQIRKPGTDKSGEPLKEEPGYETGEVLKRVDGEGKVEAIAVECPEELYQQYLEWMSHESSKRFSGAKEGFFKATEEINRSAPRGERITPIDDSGEMQA